MLVITRNIYYIKKTTPNYHNLTSESNSSIVRDFSYFQVNPSLTQEDLISYLHSKKIVTMGYSPFGFLVSRKRESAPPPRADDPSLVKMAQKYGKTTSQIVLRYLVSKE